MGKIATKDSKEIGKPKYKRGEHPNSKKNLEMGMAKPGDVLNPNGKPPGTQDRATVIKKWAGVPIEVANPADPKGPRLKVTLIDYGALGQFMSAGKGNTNAWKEIQDSLHGKQADKLEQDVHSKVIVEFIKYDGNGTSDTDKG